MGFNEIIIVGKTRGFNISKFSPTGEIKSQGIYLMDGFYEDGNKQRMYDLIKWHLQ